MRSWIARCLCLLMSALVFTGGTYAQSPPVEPLKVVVSTHPLARVVNSVASPAEVQLFTLLDAGVTPHDAVLRPRQLQQLLTADLVIWMGPEIEPYLAMWIRKRSGSTLDISKLKDLQRLPMRNHSAREHGHTHEAHFDIHLWWSRHNLQSISNATIERLSSLRPAFAPAISRKHTEFLQDMARLADEVTAGAAKMPPFAVFHDGWQYLERDVGQTAAAGFVLDGELSMGVRHLATLQKRFKETPVRCVLLEPGMNTALVDKLLPGVPTVMLDPLGWDAPGNGAVDMLRHAYQRLQSCAK